MCAPLTVGVVDYVETLNQANNVGERTNIVVGGRNSLTREISKRNLPIEIREVCLW